MSSSEIAFTRILEPNEVFEFGWYHPANAPIILKVIPAFKPPLIHVAEPTQPGADSRLVHPAPAVAPEKLKSNGSFDLVTGVEIVTEHFGVRADSGPNGIGYAHLWRVTNTSPTEEVFVQGWVFWNF